MFKWSPRPSATVELAGIPDPLDTLTEGNFPPGWNLERARRVIAEIEEEMADWTEEEEAELQAQMKGKSAIQVPNEIVPAVQELLAQHELANPVEATVGG